MLDFVMKSSAIIGVSSIIDIFFLLFSIIVIIIITNSTVNANSSSGEDSFKAFPRKKKRQTNTEFFFGKHWKIPLTRRAAEYTIIQLFT